MSRVVMLDTGPLGLLTNPKKTPETRAITRWALELMYCTPSGGGEGYC